MFKSTAALGAAALLATGASAATFQNGSFEDGTFVPSAPQAEQLLVGSTAITGWTVIGGSDIAWEHNGNPYGVVASDGVFALDLTGYSDRAPYGGVEQTFDTIAGHRYSLSYDVGNTDFQNNSGISASIDGTLLLNFVNTMQAGSTTLWQTATTSFTAGGASTQLDLVGTGGGNAINLDNVRVVDLDAGSDTGAVPEPTSWAMMIGGFGIAGLALRQRRQGLARHRTAAA